MIHEEISGKIISAAMEMLNELKLRLGEKLYERAMIRYLNITRLNLALLINSKNARLEWKRVLRPQ